MKEADSIQSCGGFARAASLSPAERKSIASKAANRRWAKQQAFKKRIKAIMKVTVTLDDYAADGTPTPITITEHEDGDNLVTIKQGNVEFTHDANELIEALSKFI